MESVRFRLGSDPELFLRDRTTKELRSAIPIIPEGKDCPRRLDNSGLNGVLHDNVLIEFNTDPADDASQFVSNIRRVMGQIEAIVAASGAELHLMASAEFPLSELKDQEAQKFGCDPDFDAYELVCNSVPAGAERRPFRSAGGHLHIGYHDADDALKQILDDPYGKVKVVKALDTFVGVPSIFLDKDPTAPARRQLYGKAGAHRPKDYGVEYRACSAWWLLSPEHTELVYLLTEDALAVVRREGELEKVIEACGGEKVVVDTINNSQAIVAQKLYKKVISKYLKPATKKQLTKVLRSKKEFRTSWGLP